MRKERDAGRGFYLLAVTVLLSWFLVGAAVFCLGYVVDAITS